jgi:hypothetical protein
MIFSLDTQKEEPPEYLQEWNSAPPEDPEVLRTKRNLACVSRAWKDVSNEFLFARMKIPSLDALLRLVSLLQDDSQLASKGRHTSYLHVAVVVPRNCRSVYIDQVCRLLELCPNITTFINAPIIVARKEAVSGGAPFEKVPTRIVHALADCCGQRLKSVTFAGDEGLLGDDVDYLLGHCSTLQSFGSTTIFADEAWRLHSESATIHTLRLHHNRTALNPGDFPSLKHLSLTVKSGAAPNILMNKAVLQAQGQRWKLCTGLTASIVHRVPFSKSTSHAFPTSVS